MVSAEEAPKSAPGPRARLKANPPSKALLYSLIGIMVWFWSVNFIVGKIALRYFPPLLLGGLRTAVAGALILPVYLVRGARPFRRSSYSASGLAQLLFLGLFGVALNQVLFIAGLASTSVAHASILIGMTPLLVLVIVAAMGLEQITAGKLAGMGIALGGIAVLNAAPARGAHTSFGGDVLVFLGAFAFAVFAAFGKRATARHGSLTVSTFAYVGGAVMLAPLTLWQSAGFSYARVGWAGWASLLYMAAFPSVVCYLIFYYALTYIPASRVSAFSYLQPLVATLLAVPLLGEPVTVSIVAGGGLVFAGVFLTERS